jgi:hypothetical protein
MFVFPGKYEKSVRIVAHLCGQFITSTVKNT